MKQFMLTLTFSLLLTTFLFGQTRTVIGTVTNIAGEPLPGTTVFVKYAGIGTTSDENGAYTLVVPEEYDLLVFSFIGYETQEVEIGDRKAIDIQLAESTSALDEVIVVGYGKQIKSKLTGNIARVGGEEIQYLPVTSIDETLQGKAAGVFIESANGKLAGDVKIQIRGISSVTAGNQPLFVVDGIPITTERFQPYSSGQVNLLASLNFNDVESVEVLKDASAAAIYGSRASNGVILITTKSGKAGNAKIDFNLQSGFSQPTRTRAYLNAAQYVDLYNRTAIGAGKYDYRTNPGGWGSEQEAIDFYSDYVEDWFDQLSGDSDWRALETSSDWQDEVLQTAPFGMADLSFSGGSEKMLYYASLGYSDQGGILIGNQYQKYNGRLNLDGTLRKNLNFGMNLNYARSVNNHVSADFWSASPMSAVWQAPITPIRDKQGNLSTFPVTVYYNPLIELEEAERDVTTNQALGALFLEWQVMPGLSLREEGGLELQDVESYLFQSSKTWNGRAFNGRGQLFGRKILNRNLRTVLDYQRNQKGALDFQFTGGLEVQKSESRDLWVNGAQFPVDDLRTLSSAAEILDAGQTETVNGFLSWFGRFNVAFDEKYLLTLSARYDGSSRFGADKKYGLFPAASVGWVLTQEPFFEKIKPFSFLKIRASYGLTGNAFIGDFQHQGLFDAAEYGGKAGLQPTQIANPDLRWEKTTQQDIGLDFGLFNNRINGELDYYLKKTTDLLLAVPIPSTSGFSTQIQNIGEIENRGVELVIHSNNLSGKFQWSTSLNFALNRNKVVKLANGQELIDNGFANVVKVGYPINSFIGAEYAGVDPANGDALFYLNTEGAAPNATTTDYNAAGQTIIGNPNPKFIAGLSNRFSIKGFSLDILLYGVFDRDIYDEGGSYSSCQACWFDNQTKDQLSAWQQPGDVTDVPEARFWFANGTQYRNSRYVQDGSFLRMRNVTLAYDFPPAFLSKGRFRRMTVYAQAQNLFIFTKYDGGDPEAHSDAFGEGNAMYSAPQPRSISVGIKLGL